MPMTRPPRSCAPRLAASMTPEYPPVQIVKPDSASSSPTRRACAYSRLDSSHFEPPKIVIIRSSEVICLRLSSRIPLWFEIAVHQPFDRCNHRLDGVRHMRKVDMRQIITGPMIILVQAKTRNRMRDDALPGQNVIV